MTSPVRRERIPPRPSSLVESMRDFGYSLHTAIADIVDNSLTAAARNIELLADSDSEAPAIAILDDGRGMTRKEIVDAMRPGSRSPLETRDDADLGRFGLGLKTASISQCRRLSVLTRSGGETVCAVWDLDTVAETDEWYVEFPERIDDIPWSDRLGSKGTLVVWEKLDRLAGAGTVQDRQSMIRQLDDTATHIELVFHRFLSGEKGQQKVRISLNGRALKSFDPFHSNHPATVFGPEDIFALGDRKIVIQPITLPHHKKVSVSDWSRYAGPEGYIKNQGFYLYREKRLIIHGTWFGLARQTELTKLARVRIDMPNGMDAEWKIDVKKASAQPPAPVRARLRSIIEVIGAGSKRAYTVRGRKLISDDRLPVWTRTQDKNEIFYGLNPEHPAFSGFLDRIPDEFYREFLKLLDLAGAAIPIEALFADVSTSPESVAPKSLDEETFSELARSTYLKLKSAGVETEDIALMMCSAEPFRSNIKLVQGVFEMIEMGEK